MPSPDFAIRVSSLSKVYPLYNSPRDRLKEALHPMRKKYHHDFYALKDVSFEVEKGETVGIIGQNGSGKSTLLKILSNVLTPTSGSCMINGKVSSLLELGTGFNPELTGIENVYFNGTLLGFSREEMDAKLDDILAFADIGEFVRQPVKTYSTGMYVRMAFAVAISVDPDVLIVDEALSVGDELFQRKCFSRIDKMRSMGVTILFVSHSGTTIVELCDNAILFDKGEKMIAGKPKQIVGYYQKLLYAPVEKQELIREQFRQKNRNYPTIPGYSEEIISANSKPDEPAFVLKESFDPNLKPTSTIAYESHGVIIDSPAVFTLSGEIVNNLIRGNTYRYAYKVLFNKSASNVRFGMLIKTTTGVELGGGSSAKSNFNGIPYIEAGTIYLVEWRFHCNLNPGVYYLNAGVTGTLNTNETYLHRLIDIAMFRVMPDTENIATGIIDFGCYPEIELQIS
ncbi:MAG: ABC transporter ATP-binding protein [Bacteroidetes bacterium]|nr:ABC transporter ATP-binding protein [Bacteroidota bacterium]